MDIKIYRRKNNFKQYMLKILRCNVKTFGIQIQFGVDKKDSPNANAIYKQKITIHSLYMRLVLVISLFLFLQQIGIDIYHVTH